jgi:hypothetical protein
MNPAEAPRIPLMRAGSTGSFIFTVVVEQHPEARMTVRFTDDADLHWQTNHDLHLSRSTTATTGSGRTVPGQTATPPRSGRSRHPG